MPRAVIAEAFGPPESYALRELSRRELQPGEVRVTLKAAGISFVDVLTAAGGSQCRAIIRAAFCASSAGTGGYIASEPSLAGCAIVAVPRTLSSSRWLVNLTATSTRFCPFSTCLARTSPVTFWTSPI